MRAWLDIDLDRLARNFSVVQTHVGPDSGLIAVVKSDAYGHGLLRIGAELDRLGVAGYAVISLEEALSLREASARPVLVMGYLSDEEIAEAIRRDLTLSLYDAPLADLYASIARKVGTPAKVQLKVETGLNRLGVPINEAAGLLENWSRCDALQLTGIYSHLSTSADRATDLEQLELFERFMKDHGAHLGEVPLHLCNSHGLRHFPEGFFGAVRVGLALYGVESVLPGLEPTLECRARVMQRKRVRRGEGVSYNKLFRAPKDMDVAVLAIGYAEGLSQALTGKMEVLINGHRRPVVGQICMNLCVVDVDGIPAERGDAATLIGRETMADGSTDEIRVADMAKAAGIRHHEIITRLGLSLPRRYKAACAAVEASPGSVSAAAL